MRVMIEDYENRTGEHCGSIAMRNLYAAFLREAREIAPTLVDAEAPVLASQAAEQWTILSSHLWKLGKTRSTDALAGCRRALDVLQDIETQLFERLAASVAAAR